MKLADIIKRYPETEEVVELYHEQGLSLQKIADRLKLPRERVRFALKRYERAEDIRSQRGEPQTRLRRSS